MDSSFEPLPLVIGVTGHRDLRPGDTEALKAHIETIFDRLEDEYANPRWFPERKLRRLLPALTDWAKDTRRKSASVTPMVVLSALAEGADQLVAQVAHDRGLEVIVTLPLPVAEYRRDFELQAIEPGAVKKFDDWMKRAADEGGLRPRVRTQFVGFVKDPATDKVNSLESVRDLDSLPRRLQYRHAGQFIARHCDVIIALWDGEPSDAVGGTAEIVRFKRDGIPLEVGSTARACLDSPELGPVIHVVTPRASRTGAVNDVDVKCWGEELIDRYEPPARAYDAQEKRYRRLRRKTAKQDHTNAAAARRRSTAAAEMEKIKAEMGKLKAQIDPIKDDYQLWKAFEATIRLTRRFNRAATRLQASPQGAAAAGKSLSNLFNIDESRPETKAAALQGRTVASRYCSLYAFADALAIRWRSNFRRDWIWLFVFALTAFGCFVAYSHLASIVHAYQWPAASWILDRTLLTAYVVSFAAIAALYIRATWWEHQGQFLDYRALAEALRIAVFWRLAGIEKAADAYPIRLPRELAWVKTCLLVQELMDTVTPLGNAAHPSLDVTSYVWIRDIWIKGQVDHFERTRQRHQDTAEVNARWSTRILSAAAVVALVLLGLVFSNTISRQHHLVHEGLLSLIGFLPGLAALFVGLSEKFALSAQARQCERMADVFRRAFNSLPPQFPSDIKLVERIRDVVCEVGSEAMRDSAEWVATYRQRPFSLPQT